MNATDGEIAAINLESARRRAWARFAQNPRDPGIAYAVLDNERLAAQFLGDLEALDRLDVAAYEFTRVDHSYRAALVQAEVASALHCFDEARSHLARAALMGAPRDEIKCQLLTIDQACGVNLDAVLAERSDIAAANARPENLVPFAAVLADVERFAEADDVYQRAFFSHDGISPFPPAWVCFQLGMMWGEVVPEPDLDLATVWYRRAIAYVPGYVKARAHLAEISASQGHFDEAESLLLPALSSNDPEIRWCLAGTLAARGEVQESEQQLEAARLGFERLLKRHPLAFADHAAAFYAADGNDTPRALELALVNAANRPTRRAKELVQTVTMRVL